MTNYDKFLSALNLCNDMASEYLVRCMIEGTVDPDNKYYFRNLLALHIDPSTGLPRILCSNTNPNDTHEAVHSYNIRFVSIDKDLMNMSDDEYNKLHVDSALIKLISQMDEESKIVLYEELKKQVENV